MRIYYRLDVVECENLGRQTSVDAEELLVEQGGEGQAVERLHAGVVNTFRIFDDAFNEITMELMNEGRAIRKIYSAMSLLKTH